MKRILIGRGVSRVSAQQTIGTSVVQVGALSEKKMSLYAALQKTFTSRNNNTIAGMSLLMACLTHTPSLPAGGRRVVGGRGGGI